MHRAFLLLSATMCALGCQGTSVVVFSSPPDGGSASACGPGGTPGVDGGTKGSRGGVWPTFAHDMQRTSHADGVGNITNPAVAWTKQLGGVLGAGHAGVGDVDGDGRPDVVTVSAGRVTATSGVGQTLWQGSLAGVDAILGIWNLDGTGAPEVVVHEPTGVAILDGADGQEVASITVDLAAAAEFVPLGPAGGILAVANAGGQLAAYDMRAGLQPAGPLWTTGVQAQIDIVPGDVDGDGVPDIVRAVDAGFEVIDLMTGIIKYAADAIGPAANVYLFELVQADSSPGLEIFAVDTSYQYSPQTGVYMLGIRDGALATLWSSTQTPQLALGADYYAVDGAVADLDGDGLVETVYSEWDAGTQQWTTYVVDAATGASVATIPGEIAQALADVDGDGHVDIAVRSSPLADKTPPRSTLAVFKMSSRTAGLSPDSWTLPNAHVLTTSDALRTRQGQLDHPLAAAFDGGPGKQLVVGQDAAQRRTDTLLGALRADGSFAAEDSIPSDVDVTVLWTGDQLTSQSSRDDVLSFGDDGVAHVLTSGFKEAASFRAGSYANWIGVYGLDATRAIVCAATSNRDLLWLDGTHLQGDGTPHQTFGLTGVVDSSSLGGARSPARPDDVPRRYLADVRRVAARGDRADPRRPRRRRSRELQDSSGRRISRAFAGALGPGYERRRHR